MKLTSVLLAACVSIGCQSVSEPTQRKNAIALRDAHEYAMTATGETTDGKPFVIGKSKLKFGFENQLHRLARNPDLPEGRLLVSTDPINRNGSDPPKPIAVFDKPYRLSSLNVVSSDRFTPRSKIGLPPFGYAVGYDTSQANFISEAQFKRLDLSHFVPLEKFYSPSYERWPQR